MISVLPGEVLGSWESRLVYDSTMSYMDATYSSEPTYQPMYMVGPHYN